MEGMTIEHTREMRGAPNILLSQVNSTEGAERGINLDPFLCAIFLFTLDFVKL